MEQKHVGFRRTASATDSRNLRYLVSSLGNFAVTARREQYLSPSLGVLDEACGWACWNELRHADVLGP